MNEEKALPMIKTVTTPSQMNFGNHLRPQENIVDISQVSVTKNKMVTLVAIVNQAHKEPRASFTCFTDENGNTWGIPLKINPKDGTMVFRRNTIDGTFTFNLNRKDEANTFELWKRSPFVEGGLKTSNITPLFKIYDQEVEADRKVTLAAMRNKNYNHFIKLKDSDLMDFALNVIGAAASSHSSQMILSMIMDVNEKSPEKIEAIIGSKTSESTAVFERAFAVGLIRFDQTRGYITEHGAILGYDKVQAQRTISSRPDLFRSLDSESRNRFSSGKIVTQENSPNSEDQIKMAVQSSQDPDGMQIHAMQGVSVQDHQKLFPGTDEPMTEQAYDPFESIGDNLNVPLPNVAINEDELKEQVEEAKPKKKK